MKLDIVKDVERIQKIAKIVKLKFFKTFGSCDITSEAYADSFSTIVDVEFSEDYDESKQNSYIANACYNKLIATYKRRIGYWLKNRPKFVHDQGIVEDVPETVEANPYREYLIEIVKDVVDSLDGRFKEIVLDYLKTTNCSKTAANLGISKQYAAEGVDYFRTKCFNLKRVRDEFNEQ